MTAAKTHKLFVHQLVEKYPRSKKRSLRAMIVLVLPGKKKGETENFLSNDTPHSFLAIPVSVTSPKTKLPPGNVNG